jgi:hypothetical protein
MLSDKNSGYEDVLIDDLNHVYEREYSSYVVLSLPRK